MSRFRTVETADPRFIRGGLLPVTFKSPALKARADMTLYVPPGIESARNVPVSWLRNCAPTSSTYFREFRKQ